MPAATEAVPEVTPDVTVVVAVYNPGPNIDGLLASLDGQTLPPGALEVVAVDDGSTDGTLERLTQLALDRPYLVVRSIPNSGWPGRPRNIGIDASRGEFVFFADHDDEFFPDALEHLLETARRNDADVVYPKVVRKGLSTPYWELAHRDVEVAELVGDQLVVSRSVHKLYRRDFLMQHGIRFPEGRVRLEDHHFMGQVLARRPRVSIVASRPGYVWIHRPDGTNTSTTPVDLAGYFGYVAESVDLLLDGADSALRRQVAEVSLARIFLPLRADTWVQRDREEQLAALSAVGRFLDDYVPSDLEDALPRLKQWSVQAVHAGDVDSYDGLVQLRFSLRQTVTVDDLRWSADGDTLCVETTAVATDPGGVPLPVQGRGDELVLPAELGAPVDGDATLREPDFGSGELTIRHRASGVEWPLPSSTAFRGHTGTGRLHLRLAAEISPTRDPFGHELATGIWDVLARVDLLGERQVPRVRVDQATLPEARQVGGRHVQPYRTADGTLAFKVRDPAAELAAKPAVTGADSRREGLRLHLRLPSAPAAGASGDARAAEVLVRVRGSRPEDVLARADVTAGQCVVHLPDRPVGTVLDLWARTGSGPEQRLAHDIPDSSDSSDSPNNADAPDAREPAAWRGYATAHGSFSLKRVATRDAPARSGLRRWLGR